MKIRLLRSAIRAMVAVDLLYFYLRLSRGPSYQHPDARYLAGLALPAIAACSGLAALWLMRTRRPARGRR